MTAAEIAGDILLKALEIHKHRIFIAIDGSCASGKTTVAAEIGGNVFHADDFFLRPFQRTEERLSQAGGNVDYERIRAEILLPLSKDSDAVYRPYSCKSGLLLEERRVPPQKINVLEGAYSCHPRLWDFFDLHVFLTADYDERLRRITARNGSADAFVQRWIPLEEKYFGAYNIEARCEMRFSTSEKG